MKVVSSTQARQNFSFFVESAADEPITISKKDKEIAVLISAARYQELKRLEDILYGKAAELAIKEGFANSEEADNLLNNTIFQIKGD